MAKESKRINLNYQFRDSSSKIIFGDNILCSQFLRNYADMEILRDSQPEDLEDVTERYSHHFTSERESDVVKKVNIGKYLSVNEDENPLELPLYIVSLIEHKTKVEYNVGMQILRYTIYIWEDYEKEMDKKYPHLPKEQVDGILKDTPEYLLDIMERMMRALLYSINLEEEKAENAVSKIKERKMGRLFEGITFDFQAARKEFEEKAAKAEADAKLRIEAKLSEIQAEDEYRKVAE